MKRVTAMILIIILGLAGCSQPPAERRGHATILFFSSVAKTRSQPSEKPKLRDYNYQVHTGDGRLYRVITEGRSVELLDEFLLDLADLERLPTAWYLTPQYVIAIRKLEPPDQNPQGFAEGEVWRIVLYEDATIVTVVPYQPPYVSADWSYSCQVDQETLDAVLAALA